MTTVRIAETFPEQWIYGEYENKILDSVQAQIDSRWPNANNILLNLTWTGPQTRPQVDQLGNQTVDNLFVISTVDAALPHVYQPLVNTIDATNVYYLGNFEGPHYFNFFAIVCADHFETYQEQELVLKDVRHAYVSYNRKPYPHRLKFVQSLVAHNLLERGVVTMGKNFPDQPDHGLYMSIGEQSSDYVKYGHWYPEGTASTPHDIPHDLFSLHNWSVWQHHFMHIVGTTAIYNNEPVFINQIDFKPIIGLRPFLINGQTSHYKFLREAGFRTFNHYFPSLDLEVDGGQGNGQLTQALTQAVQQLCNMSNAELLAMYNDMLPDLLHNRARWFEWANEQKQQVKSLFNERS
jgi:hypothetical protein